MWQFRLTRAWRLIRLYKLCGLYRLWACAKWQPLDAIFPLSTIWATPMKRLLCVFALAMMLCGQASASIVFSDDFNAYNSGTGVLNFTGFASNWTVTAGTVDLIGNPGFWDFPPVSNGHGLYIDMDGSTGVPGTLTSKSIAVSPGVYTLSYELAGSQRNDVSNAVIAAVPGFTSNTVTLASTAAFTAFTNQFTVLAPTTINITFAGQGPGDNIGLLLDNVKLQMAPVPEPAAMAVWSLLGTAALGCCWWRRRKS